jgi:membrane-associated HD superfamily phosphohydrolase
VFKEISDLEENKFPSKKKEKLNEIKFSIDSGLFRFSGGQFLEALKSKIFNSKNYADPKRIYKYMKLLNKKDEEEWKKLNDFFGSQKIVKKITFLFAFLTTLSKIKTRLRLSIIGTLFSIGISLLLLFFLDCYYKPFTWNLTFSSSEVSLTAVFVIFNLTLFLIIITYFASVVLYSVKDLEDMVIPEK